MMKKILNAVLWGIFSLVMITIASCFREKPVPADESTAGMDLRNTKVASCGTSQNEFGAVEFATSCPDKVKPDFNLAMALLHSFEYEEAEKVFAKIIREEPQCAMGYWGVAMANFHPLWAPPTQAELKKGAKAIAVARSLTQISGRESAYIKAIGSFYDNQDKKDHKTRCIDFEHAMEKIYRNYPADKEAAIFYALALAASADQKDKTFKNQKKAYRILTSLYPGQPDHPGIVHYIIHSYDYPGLAILALPAAKKYASIAPSSAHAQHMPSHIFTRLGLWDESISSNLDATSSAKCYAENTGMKGHWDEELHGLDYLVYSYLQKGDNKLAKAQWDYLKTIHEVNPLTFKVAYAFASIPSRYVLENKMWKDAAELKIHPSEFPWQKFPWQASIVHFTRILGSVHTNDIASAKAGLSLLRDNYNTLIKQGELYQANQVENQLQAAEAWILFKEGKEEQALALMKIAADMEDKTEKHPVTPAEVLPARELLGDMLIQMHKPAEALIAYETNLVKHPNRFNGIYGAAVASQKSNDPAKAAEYYQKLTQIAISTDSDRPELAAARLVLNKNKP